MFKPVSPLDDRYAAKVQVLGGYFSEFALMQARVSVELEFLLSLDQTRLFPALTAGEQQNIENLLHGFDENHYQEIKEVEAQINHDVKACEVFIINHLQLSQPNMVHFGLTSEDVNNLAWTRLLKNYRDQVLLPQISGFLQMLADLTEEWQNDPFPARTHGQMASPTTAGKEMAVYLNRFLRLVREIKNFRFYGKLNGATGGYSAFQAAFPQFDWISFSDHFLQQMGLEPNPATTQIEDHDHWVGFLQRIQHFNLILADFDRDIWFYLTLGYLLLSAEAGAVGSSTMPHKVNPINFENSEGNLAIAESVAEGMIRKLMSSRLQRDLSDSTTTRNFGLVFGHSYLALAETIKGLGKLSLNRDFCRAEISRHPELLAEPIQTILRRERLPNPYDLLKDLTRGKDISAADLATFYKQLPVNDQVKAELSALRPELYTGLSVSVCQRVLADWAEFRKEQV